MKKQKKASESSRTIEKKRGSTEKKTKTKDSSEKSQKKSKKSTTQEQDVCDEEQHKPEELPVPESNTSPKSNAAATATTTPAEEGYNSKTKMLENQLTKWFIDRKIENWQGFVDNLTEQEKKNITNLLKMSAEKQLKS